MVYGKNFLLSPLINGGVKYRPCIDSLTRDRTQYNISVMLPWNCLWIVLQHMRDVAERRQLLEAEHKEALLVLQEKQEEVRRLQQVCSMGEMVLYSVDPSKQMGLLHYLSLEKWCIEEILCESTKWSKPGVNVCVCANSHTWVKRGDFSHEWQFWSLTVICP